MTAKQKYSLVIRFGDWVLGKKHFRFLSYLLPSQCAERIEKMAYRTFHHDSFAGECRVVSLQWLDENSCDFVVTIRTNDPLSYPFVSAKGHLDVDSLTTYTVIQGVTTPGKTPLILCGWMALVILLLFAISLSPPIIILGSLPLAANGLIMLRNLYAGQTALVDDLVKTITARKHTSV
jgi:hypothetical protein